jgi:S-adenosylmethionine:tRNA ribosyltransferase-isomerase
VSHRRFADLPAALREGDLLVRNDARVIPARLFGATPEGTEVEIFLLRRIDDSTWRCLTRPGRRTRRGTTIQLAEGVSASVIDVDRDGTRAIAFAPALSLELLNRIGHVPLPPYIRRPDNKLDSERYQTIFAVREGAVAAPTAGLHFTEQIFDLIRARGVGIADLSLLVGPGTFKPVTSRDTEDHRMDFEDVSIPEETEALISATKRRGGRVIAVGTTVTRALESWARKGRNRFSTDLFVTPGFEFRVVDLLLTNFHLPRSTLLMLVCAFAGLEQTLAAYAEAIREGYLFYSYGDAMLVVSGERQGMP